jgi:hypothetical protein
MHAYLLSYECKYDYSQIYIRILSCHCISNCFYWVSHELTLWATILSDKLIAPHILKNYLPPPIQKIFNVSNVFEKFRDLYLS